MGFKEEDLKSRTLVRDLYTPRPALYWGDLLMSAGIGWSAFGAAAFAFSPLSAGQLLFALAAVFALYRALSFIHEISHIRKGMMPGFETAWNLLAGYPLLMPSFVYTGVHQSHHNPSSYGTIRDPEYLPFAASRRMTVVFAVESFLVPAALMLRFLVAAPMGLLIPTFQKWLEKYASSLVLNFSYRREITPALSQKIRKGTLQLLAVWALAFILLPLHVFVLWFGVLSLASFINTLRTLGAHKYEGDGASFDRAGQLRDSIDVPGRFWTALWAPVGLRYHALHHYFPGIPYHNLGTAHRRLTAALPESALYPEQSNRGLVWSLWDLLCRGGSRNPEPVRD